jgi:hypothetical protein
MQKRFVAFLIAVLVAAGAGMATAQERFGGLTGIVTDASGAVLPERRSPSPARTRAPPDDRHSRAMAL